LEAMYVHEKCLSQGARAHIWGNGKCFNASRLGNVGNKAWARFKARCELAYKEAQRERAAGRQAKKPRPDKKTLKATTLTFSVKAKKAGRGRAGIPEKGA
jgi:hypothetical protein